MSSVTLPRTTQQAAERAWEIRRLYQEGAVDRLAGIQALGTLAHDHPCIGKLVKSIVSVGLERPIREREPIVETFV